jgi:hypothetical protein
MSSWARLIHAVHQRAIFRAGGGLMTLDVGDPAHPKAKAFFPSFHGSIDVMVDEEDALHAAGRFGIHKLDDDTSNILQNGD